MLKNSFLLLFCLFSLYILTTSSVFFEKKATECSLNWVKERKLNWEDFRGRPEAGVRAIAMTHSGFQTFPSNEKIGAKTYVRTKVIAQFDCDESWVRRSERENAYALHHEQGHFDISEIYARKLEKLLNEKPIPLPDYNRVLDVIYDRVFSEMGNYQERYDAETDHSLNRPKQSEWDKSIAVQLEATEKKIVE